MFRRSIFNYYHNTDHKCLGNLLKRFRNMRRYIYPCLCRLTVLKPSWNIIKPVILNEFSSRLLEIKWYTGAETLLPKWKYPVVAAGAGIVSRLPSCYHFNYSWTQIHRQVDLLKQRFTDYWFFLYRRIKKDRQSVIRPILILTGTADMNVIVARSPIMGDTIVKSVYPFCYKKKFKLGALFYHLPTFIPPAVGVFKEKVTWKAEINYSVPLALQFILSVFVLFYRKIKGFVFSDPRL